MRRKLDTKSLHFKMWIYFSLFAILLMLVLWCLQILFLKTYYEDMKIKEIGKVASTISSFYGKYSEKDFAAEVLALSQKNDMYIYVEKGNGEILFTADDNYRSRPFGYPRDMAEIKQRVLSSETGSVSIIFQTPHDSNNILAYGKLMKTKSNGQALLYIYSPLTPVDSTVNILADQLVRVTAISILLAMMLSFWLSSKLTKPIRNITNSALELAEGHYGITFEGGDYSEIKCLADTLTATSKELAKADNLQKDLIANVSHDLRTPLTMVKSYAEMIRDLSGDNPEKRNAHLQVIIGEADRLNQLVSDMLILSKMQSGVEAMNISDFNLKDASESLINSYDILEEQDGYRFNFLCDGDALISGDENRIKQVISNLLNNAVKYCGDSKDITVSLSHTKNKGVRFTVTDTGPGIPANELESIWMRYYKASGTHQRTVAGSGLGLSIVKEILDLHNATYGVESQLGKGSTFWFELKLKPAPKENKKQLVLKVPKRAVPASDPNKDAEAVSPSNTEPE